MTTKPDHRGTVHGRKAALPASRGFARPELVPYITRWSEEREASMPVVARRNGRGIAYADERSYDRDANGVLWTRTPSQPGRGRPEYGSVHSLRQRLAMGGLLCQICGKPAARNRDGVLWLLDAEAEDPELWQGEEHTTHPPVCLPCAAQSTAACPHLRRRYVALRVRAFALSGVHGALYQRGETVPVRVDVTGLRFGDPRMPWMRGGQLVMHLSDFTKTDLQNEAGSGEMAEISSGRPG